MDGKEPDCSYDMLKSLLIALLTECARNTAYTTALIKAAQQAGWDMALLDTYQAQAAETTLLQYHEWLINALGPREAGAIMAAIRRHLSPPGPNPRD